MNRQPRATLVIGTLVVGGDRDVVDPARQPAAPAGTRRSCCRSRSGWSLVAAIVVGIAWPGGLLRHDVAPPEPITPTTTPSTTATGPTGATGATSTTGASGTSGANGTTPDHGRSYDLEPVTATNGCAPASKRSIRSRSTRSSAGRSTPSTPGGRCSSPRRRARARRSSPSTRSPRRSTTGGKAFYTTPLKALSNQKYGDFVRVHGAANVGLLTGDNAINGDAPIVVMTTEVLRNMIYARSPALDGLRYVVLDEVHYLQDPAPRARCGRR